MIRMKLQPVDTLFFRDGTPFSAGSASQDEVGGLFPPNPETVMGALRAGLALANGWDGKRRWPETLDPVLGDGPANLGRLAMEGPFLIQGDQCWFPMPRHLLGTTEGIGEEEAWKPELALRPGAPVPCELGPNTRLPHAPDAGKRLAELVEGDGYWVSAAGLEQVLRGALPGKEDVQHRRSLWRFESRIGLERDHLMRSAVEGKLYSSRHARLQPETGLCLSLKGVSEDWSTPLGSLVQLGGERRMVECQEWQDGISLEMPLDEVEEHGRVMGIALTPLELDRECFLGKAALDWPGEVTVVSGCTTKPHRIGGWDSIARKPVALRSVLPAGSVLFCEAGSPENLVGALKKGDGLPRLGARQAWGYGVMAIGTWSDEPEVKA